MMILNVIILFSDIFNILLHVRVSQRGGTPTGNHLGKLEGIVTISILCFMFLTIFFLKGGMWVILEVVGVVGM